MTFSNFALHFQPGISTPTLTLLCEFSREAQAKDRIVTLMFDAIHLQAHVEYLYTSDEIVGLVTTDADKRNDELAQSVLVFMIRSVFAGWCQVWPPLHRQQI